MSLGTKGSSSLCVPTFSCGLLPHSAVIYLLVCLPLTYVCLPSSLGAKSESVNDSLVMCVFITNVNSYFHKDLMIPHITQNSFCGSLLQSPPCSLVNFLRKITQQTPRYLLDLPTLSDWLRGSFCTWCEAISLVERNNVPAKGRGGCGKSTTYNAPLNKCYTQDPCSLGEACEAAQNMGLGTQGESQQTAVTAGSANQAPDVFLMKSNQNRWVCKLTGSPVPLHFANFLSHEQQQGHLVPNHRFKSTIQPKSCRIQLDQAELQTGVHTAS